MFKTHLDQRIFKTIRGHTSNDPQTLVGIIAGVDAMERMILTPEELAGGLQRLVDSGSIIEIEKHRFIERSDAPGNRPFSGVDESDYKAAVKQYEHWFHEQLDKINIESNSDDFVWQKLAFRLALPENRSPNYEDEDAAENFAALIEPVIVQSGLGEINGFEHSLGHIDVLIFGKAIDADVDQIYDLLAPMFHKANCPPGSRIIRFYNERNEEIESDIVPQNAI
jgi:hypothetical protein